MYLSFPSSPSMAPSDSVQTSYLGDKAPRLALPTSASLLLSTPAILKSQQLPKRLPSLPPPRLCPSCSPSLGCLFSLITWQASHLAKKRGNVRSVGSLFPALSHSSPPELEGSTLGTEPPVQSGLEGRQSQGEFKALTGSLRERVRGLGLTSMGQDSAG